MWYLHYIYTLLHELLHTVKSLKPILHFHLRTCFSHFYVKEKKIPINDNSHLILQPIIKIKRTPHHIRSKNGNTVCSKKGANGAVMAQQWRSWKRAKTDSLPPVMAMGQARELPWRAWGTETWFTMPLSCKTINLRVTLHYKNIIVWFDGFLKCETLIFICDRPHKLGPHICVYIQSF